MKRSFIPVCFLRDEEGAAFTDEDGANYLVPCEHEPLAGKEFVNEIEAIQTIRDWEADQTRAEGRRVVFKGEVILLQVLTF